MKNYDIKNATVELSAGKKIKVSAKRIAFLVPNMFSKLKSGFGRKVSLMVSKFDVEDAKEQAQVVKEEVVEAKVAKIDEKIEAKEEAMVQTKASANINDDLKSYIIKAYESDIEKLYTKKARVSTAPRRLLISTVFLRKLISNRKKRFVADRIVKKEEKQLGKQIEEQLANMPSFEEKKEVNAVDSVEKAMERYIELNNERLKIQNELTELVKKFGLTKEMFEQKGRIK